MRENHQGTLSRLGVRRNLLPWEVTFSLNLKGGVRISQMNGCEMRAKEDDSM